MINSGNKIYNNSETKRSAGKGKKMKLVIKARDKQ